MPVTPQDRPLNSLREETVDQLIMNYGHGKLSLQAFERRLDQALDAKSHDALLSLTQDLDLVADKTYTEQKKTELGIRTASLYAEEADGTGGTDHMINIFGGTNRRGAWNVPSRINMLNIFGGADLDFSDARFTSRTTRITLFCVFGGANFYVRDGINTVSKALCIFGGIDNRAPSTSDRDAPTLLIQGLVLFGGARIKVRKTARERLLEFADSIRNMFAPPAR
jgi:hypothetical protein